MDNKSAGMLLESASNELEIVEFSIGSALYGINVAKVREIIKADIDFVPIADVHASMQGAINLRGNIIPVVNLSRHLKIDLPFDKKINRIIIAEFNGQAMGFLVTSVALIHRLSWKNVEEPSQMLRTQHSCASGVVKIDNKVIFLLDFEKIAYQINPRTGMKDVQQVDYGAAQVDRSSKKILIAEDSDFMRQMIVDHLQKAGYSTDTASNGEEAWVKLSTVMNNAAFERVDQFYHLLVTDIEMPQMDGLHLIKRIKDEAKLRRLPCIAFSSIVSKDIIVQCRKFGADAEISKPEISQLVTLVDAKVL